MTPNHERRRAEEQYWERIASEHYDPETKILRDNWTKRQHIVRMLLEYDFSGKRILEIGCGLGIVATALRIPLGPDFDYIGTDICERFCQIASELNRLDVYYARADSLPFESDSFDYLFLFDVMEHVRPDNRADIYSEVDRVLMKNSLVFLNNPLTQSRHDPEFDFGYDESDMADFCRVCRMHIERVTTYGLRIKDSEYRYQFVVMRR